MMSIGVAARKKGARKIRPVGRIRPDLRLETDGVRLTVQPPALSGDRTIEVVARIDLQARLIGQQLQHASGARRLEARRQLQFSGIAKTEIVVVALAMEQLLVIAANPRPDRRRF